MLDTRPRAPPFSPLSDRSARAWSVLIIPEMELKGRSFSFGLAQLSRMGYCGPRRVRLSPQKVVQTSMLLITCLTRV